MRQTFLALALSLLSTGFAQAGDVLPHLAGRTIVAVTENAYTPLNFADPATGKGVGWEYDAFNEIAKRLDAKVDWKTASWDVMVQAVRDGQYDVGMDGITIKDDRKKQVDFSAPYMVSEMVMLVRADESRFAEPKAFAKDTSLLIGAQPGTTNFYTAVNNVLDGNEQNPRIKLFDTFGASVQALKTKDVDLVLMDRASAAGYIGASPDAFKLVGQPLGREEFGFIFKPGSDLVGPVDAALKSMQDDGTLAALNRKWFFDYQSKH